MAPAQMSPKTRVNTWLADYPAVLRVLMLSTRDISTQISSGPHRSQLRNSLQLSCLMDGNITYFSFMPTIFRSLNFIYSYIVIVWIELPECLSLVLLECLFSLGSHLWIYHFILLLVICYIFQHTVILQVHQQIIYVIHLSFGSFQYLFLILYIFISFKRW